MQTVIRTTFAAPLLVALLAFAASRTAHAADVPVKGEVTVILAKEAAGEFDPKLKQIAALQKMPFSAFKSMKVLATNPIELAQGKDVKVAMPDGSNLRIQLVERADDGRNTLQWSIDTSGKEGTKATMKMVPGKPFLIVGPPHDGGTLVIVVRVGEEPKKK